MTTRIWLGPPGGEPIGTTADGTPITASPEAGVGPMVELTAYFTGAGFTPTLDPPGWYDDHAWETGDDAHTVTFPARREGPQDTTKPPPPPNHTTPAGNTHHTPPPADQEGDAA